MVEILELVVFPNAKVKIFLVATAEERARRRYNEFLEKKVEITYDEVLKSLKERDYVDSTRKESPLKKADDAIETGYYKLNNRRCNQFHIKKNWKKYKLRGTCYEKNFVVFDIF